MEETNHRIVYHGFARKNDSLNFKRMLRGEVLAKVETEFPGWRVVQLIEDKVDGRIYYGALIVRPTQPAEDTEPPVT